MPGPHEERRRPFSRRRQPPPRSSGRQRIAIIVTLALALVLALLFTPPEALRAIARGFLAQRSLAIMLLLFGLLMLSLLWETGQDLDVAIFLLINVRANRSSWLDRAMWWLTQLGNMGTAAVLATAFLLAGGWHLAVEIVLGVISLWLVVETVKALTSRKRPYISLARARIVGWREPGHSFPSGHTSQAFFLASLLAHHFQLGLWFSAAIYSLAALVGFTRMYVGAHYPRDVLGGLIAGWVWGTVAALANQGWIYR